MSGRWFVTVPLEIATHPVLTPLVCTSNVLDSGDRALPGRGFIIPLRSDLEDIDGVADEVQRSASMTFSLTGRAKVDDSCGRSS